MPDFDCSFCPLKKQCLDKYGDNRCPPCDDKGCRKCHIKPKCLNMLKEGPACAKYPGFRNLVRKTV